MPPATDASVHQNASRKARRGCAIDIGISMMSGGTGKKELSAKATAASAHCACGLPAAPMHQSYRRRSNEGGWAAWAVMTILEGRERSTALADVSRLESDDLASLRRLRKILGDLFRNPEQLFAPSHFVPHVVGVNSDRDP